MYSKAGDENNPIKSIGKEGFSIYNVVVITTLFGTSGSNQLYRMVTAMTREDHQMLNIIYEFSV